MTKQHFKRFAEIIKADLDETRVRFPNELKRTEDAANYAASTFARVAAEANPRFDRDKFMIACGLRTPVIPAKAMRQFANQHED